MAYQNKTPVLEEEFSIQGVGDSSSTVNLEYEKKENVFFAFIDVLGFQQTFNENAEKPTSEFAERYKNTFLYYLKLMEHAYFSNSEDLVYWGQTSDSLFFYTNRIDYVAQFLQIYTHFSIYAMKQNVFFRGGIAKGRLFLHRREQFYGDCVIKAFLLESKIAKYPCIALDEETYLELKKDSVGQSLIAAKQGCRYYVKPFMDIQVKDLRTLISLNESEFHTIDDEAWSNIKEQILLNRKRFEFEDNNYQKYVFLETKLDEFLKENS